MNLSEKRKFKLKIHKALRETLFILRNFQNKENLENDEEVENYIKMTKEKFNDIILKIRKEIERDKNDEN